jgi:acyl-CoA thioester hydrolase
MVEFNWSVRVYYEDTDAGGVVFYANYLKFFERARTEWFRSLGIGLQQMQDEHQAIFVVKASAVEYHAPARLDDELRISAVVEKIGNASVVFKQEACLGEKLLASAVITICCIDSLAWKAKVIPAQIVQQLKNVKMQ